MPAQLYTADRNLTVHLRMIEFSLILQTVKSDLGAGMLFRLRVGTTIMLLFGFLDEALIINPWDALMPSQPGLAGQDSSSGSP